MHSSVEFHKSTRGGGGSPIDFCLKCDLRRSAFSCLFISPTVHLSFKVVQIETAVEGRLIVIPFRSQFAILGVPSYMNARSYLGIAYRSLGDCKDARGPSSSMKFFERPP